MLSGDFQLTANTCGATLAAQTGCSLSVAFTPTANGVRNGTLAVSDDAGTQTASLTGTGNSPATDTLAPLALTFAAQQIGTSSATQQVLLTNSGDVALTLVSASISSGPFTAVNGCGASLAAHATCAINVAFVPVTTGSANGVLTVNDQFRSQTVTLSGTGVAPAGVSLTPTAGLAFGAIGVGLTSLTQSMTLTNNGGVTLTISSIAASGDFHLASTTCGATLAPNAACTVLIVFAPTAGGARTGALMLSDNAASGTQTAALSGTGIDFTLAATGPTSVNRCEWDVRGLYAGADRSRRREWNRGDGLYGKAIAQFVHGCARDAYVGRNGEHHHDSANGAGAGAGCAALVYGSR